MQWFKKMTQVLPKRSITMEALEERLPVSSSAAGVLLGCGLLGAGEDTQQIVAASSQETPPYRVENSNLALDFDAFHEVNLDTFVPQAVDEVFSGSTTSSDSDVWELTPLDTSSLLDDVEQADSIQSFDDQLLLELASVSNFGGSFQADVVYHDITSLSNSGGASSGNAVTSQEQTAKPSDYGFSSIADDLQDEDEGVMTMSCGGGGYNYSHVNFAALYSGTSCSPQEATYDKTRTPNYLPESKTVYSLQSHGHARVTAGGSGCNVQVYISDDDGNWTSSACGAYWTWTKPPGVADEDVEQRRFTFTFYSDANGNATHDADEDFVDLYVQIIWTSAYLDLDIDSDNDDILSRSEEEDAIEEDSPGKLIAVGADELTPMVLEVYSDTGGTVSLDIPSHYDVYQSGVTTPLNSGTYTMSQLGFGYKGGVTTLLVQANSPSSDLGVDSFTATVNPNGGVPPVSDTVVATAWDVEVSWKRHGNDGAELTANPNGGGKRVFPEQTTPEASSLKNVVDLEFTITPALDRSRVVHYKFLDPDNYIGLGKNDDNATAWTGNDNHFNPTPIQGTVTVPAGGSGIKEHEIDPAHAGDNWIVIAAPTAPALAGVALGTTEATRYTVQPNAKGVPPAHTEMLTVWRTLWMELDQMAHPDTQSDPILKLGTLHSLLPKPIKVTDDNYDHYGRPTRPKISLLQQQMERACISVVEFERGAEGLNKTLEVQFVHNLDMYPLSPVYAANTMPILKNGSTFAGNVPLTPNVPIKNTLDSNATGWANSAVVDGLLTLDRDIKLEQLSDQFWFIYGIGAYEGRHDRDGDPSIEGAQAGVASPSTYEMEGLQPLAAHVFYIFVETCRDRIVTDELTISGDVFLARVTMHESLHFFLGPDQIKDPNNSDQLIPNPLMTDCMALDPGTATNEQFVLSLAQIQAIQAKPKPWIDFSESGITEICE